MAIPQRAYEIFLPAQQELQRTSVYRPRSRPNPRRRFNTRGLIIATGFWLCVVTLSGFLAYRNALIQHELDQITQIRQEIQLVERELQWLQAQAHQKLSLAVVDAWATEHGLERAEELIILPADLSRVIAEPKDPTVAPMAAEDKPHLLDVIFSVLFSFTRNRG